MSEAKKPLIVYSGEVKKADCGELTPYRDISGAPLYTGDIVCVFTELYVPDSLTVVVQNQGNPWEASAQEFYIMGIADVPLHDAGEWRVKKLKDHADVIDGESWPDWGFRYAVAIQKATGEQA